MEAGLVYRSIVLCRGTLASGRAETTDPSHSFTPFRKHISEGPSLCFVSCRMNVSLPLARSRQGSEVFYWFLHIDETKGDINLSQW